MNQSRVQERHENARPAAEIELFVSPEGNDQWLGTSPEADEDAQTGPLATVQRARDILRERRLLQGWMGHTLIWVRGGRYRLARPIEFDARDSDITIAAYKDEQPVFDGGERIEQWENVKVNGVDAWRSDVSVLLKRLGRPFRSLFVNGRRCDRTRYPKQGFLEVSPLSARNTSLGEHAGAAEAFSLFAGTDRVVMPSDFFDIARSNATDIELRLLHLWTDERMPVQSLDVPSRELRSTHRSIMSITGAKEGWLRQRAFVENVFEALAEPGEWYLDFTAGQLYYVPRRDENWHETEIIVPCVYQFLRIEGDISAGHVVDRFIVAGLTFRHSDWVQPANDWRKRYDPYRNSADWHGRDSFEHFVHNNGIDPDVQYASVPQAAHNVPGAVDLWGARRCRIERCTIEHIGFYALTLGEGCESNYVGGNTIRDIGGGGVKVDGASYPSDPRRFSARNRICDNLIEQCGRVFFAACGILITHGCGHIVAHNEIRDLRYSGISVGWTWHRDQTLSRDNLIEHNHIHHIGGELVLSDLAGIYLLGIQPGTVLRHNLIHDIDSDAYSGNGIYLDGSTANVHVDGNLVFNTRAAPITNNADCCENSYTNNLLIAVNTPAITVARNPRRWNVVGGGPGRAATFLRNVIVTAGHAAFESGFVDPDIDLPAFADMIISEANVLWDQSNQAAPAGLALPTGRVIYSLEEWQRLGQDQTSTAVDPGLQYEEGGVPSLPGTGPRNSAALRPMTWNDVGPRSRLGGSSPGES